METLVPDESGKITRWTDYFDVSLPVKLLQGESGCARCGYVWQYIKAAQSWTMLLHNAFH